MSCAWGGGSSPRNASHCTDWHTFTGQGMKASQRVGKASGTHPFWSPGERRLPRSGIQSPGGVFNLKGVLTLFTQNNTNMQRSSKSIVVKQRGGWAALAACPPWTRLAPAERRHRRPQSPGLWTLAASAENALRYALSTLQLTLYILVKYI